MSSVVVDADLKLLPTSTFIFAATSKRLLFNGVIEEIGGWQEYGETTEIGDMVFTSILAYSAFHISDSSNGAGKLKSLSFKSGLKRIGRSAFANIDTLESLSLPNTVEEIAMDALGRNIWGTDPLKKIEVTGDSDTDAGVIYGDSDNFALLVRGTGMGAAGSEGDTLMYVAKSNASVTVYRIPQGRNKNRAFGVGVCQQYKGIGHTRRRDGALRRFGRKHGVARKRDSSRFADKSQSGYIRQSRGRGGRIFAFRRKLHEFGYRNFKRLLQSCQRKF